MAVLEHESDRERERRQTGALPAPVLERTCRVTKDGAACLLAAANPAFSTGRLIAGFALDQGGTPEASVVGHGFRTAAAMAALATPPLQIDADPAVLGDAKLALVAPLRERFAHAPERARGRSALAAAKQEKFAAFVELARSGERQIRPERVIATLNRLLPEHVVIVADPGHALPVTSLRSTAATAQVGISSLTGRTMHPVAEAFGMQGWRVEGPEQLEPTLRKAIEAGGPTLVDVIAQPLQEAQAPVSEWVA